jgi:hypothetical protein
VLCIEFIFVIGLRHSLRSKPMFQVSCYQNERPKTSKEGDDEGKATMKEKKQGENKDMKTR